MRNKRKYYVYKYYVNDKLVYIGQTQVNPYDRYRQHVLEETIYSQVTAIELMEVPTEIDMCLLETYLIALYQPPWNIKDRDKSIPTLKLLYSDNFIKYDKDTFIRKFGNSFKLPYSRNKLIEIGKYPRLNEDNINNLDFLTNNKKHFTYKNHIISLHYNKEFVENYLNYFKVNDNYYFKLNNLDSTKILNSYIKIENISTGKDDKIYFVEHIDFINKEFYCRCNIKDQISEDILNIIKGVE